MTWLAWLSTVVLVGYFICATAVDLFTEYKVDVRIDLAVSALSSWICFVWAVSAQISLGVAFFGLAGAFFSWLLWQFRGGGRGGRGRKALRELGEKTRARVQAMVERMRPSPIPSPAAGWVLGYDAQSGR